jgi:hypothetical protein
MALRTFSSGGGVQSIAALVLSAQGEIDFPIHLFANVGNDSEHPATLRYVREIAMPYAKAQGIPFVELRKQRRRQVWEHIGYVKVPIYGGMTVIAGVNRPRVRFRDATLYEQLTKGSERSIGIPARLGGSGAPARRNCTLDFKMRVIAKWQKEHGATVENPCTTGLGISLDEFHRARRGDDLPAQRREYPLIDMRLTRQDCRNIIERAGLPVPPKSSCWFCPFHRLAKWQEMRHDEPDLFVKSVALERQLSERHERLGRGPLFFSDKGVPLDQATSPHRQLPMFTDETEDACESGYCMV